MMILGVFLVSLLTFVCSQPPHVPYVQSIEAIEGVTYQLKERIIHNCCNEGMTVTEYSDELQKVTCTNSATICSLLNAVKNICLVLRLRLGEQPARFVTQANKNKCMSHKKVVKISKLVIRSMENEIPDITDPRRHYAVLVTHIGRVADILTESGPEYPKLFIEELPSSIVIGLMDVIKVIKNTKAILEEIENHTQKIQTLINTLCTGSLVPEVCNQVVHHAVIGDPERYKKEAKLMLHAGHVAKQLLDADFVEVANEFDEQSYLIDFMHELNGLVLSISDLIVKVTQD